MACKRTQGAKKVQVEVAVENKSGPPPFCWPPQLAGRSDLAMARRAVRRHRTVHAHLESPQTRQGAIGKSRMVTLSTGGTPPPEGRASGQKGSSQGGGASGLRGGGPAATLNLLAGSPTLIGGPLL
jgi:hypothetical protein